MPQMNQEKYIVADLEVSLVGETEDKGIYRPALEQNKKFGKGLKKAGLIENEDPDLIIKTIGSGSDLIVKTKRVGMSPQNGTKVNSGLPLPSSSTEAGRSSGSGTSSYSGSSSHSHTGSEDEEPYERTSEQELGLNTVLENGKESTQSTPPSLSDEEVESVKDREATTRTESDTELRDYEYEEESGFYCKGVVSLSPSPSSSNLSLYSNGLICGDYDSEMERPKKVYKVVLTGGPCGGKTTGQARLCTFFENLGWKVFRVPEAANVLLGGGIKFSDLSEEQALKFQEELLRTMMQVESVFFTLAESLNQDCLVICDRGAMDASAFIPREQWEDILKRNQWNEVDIRDSRYHHIIHMVSAANGAELFYSIEDHASRSEGLDLARELDHKAAQAWVGHPYFDVVDNSTDFETKVCRMIQCVCQKLGIDARDRLQTNARKVKFLVRGPLPTVAFFPSGYQDFAVVHDYLQTNAPKMQARLRKRGQKGHWSYTYTVRRPELQGQVVEVKTALTQRDYCNMLAQKDHNHVTIFKTRRCFLLNDQYFQLDVYKDPCHPRCKGLILLETYSTLSGDELKNRLPEFLDISKEVTGDPRYSMFNLSLKERWANNNNFCQNLAGADLDDFENLFFCTSESGLAGY